MRYAARQMTQQPTAPPTTEQGYVQLPGWGYFAGTQGQSDIYGDALEDVPELRWPNSVLTYHRMRNDAQVDALQSSICLPISRLKWSIDPAGAPDEVVENICMNFNLPVRGQTELPARRRIPFRHADLLNMALLAPTVYGHMPFELVGDIDPDTLAWNLQALSPRLPQTLSRITVNPNGTLASITQGGTMTPGQFLGAQIDATQLAMYVWKREGGNWTGRSMLRPIFKHWLLKDRLLRIDAIKNERFGAGVPVGTAPLGGDPAQYQRTASAMRTSENGGVGLANGATMEIQGVKGVLPDTLASIQYQDEAMARSFLAMFLQLGTTQTGSRALGEQFVNFFVDALASFANWYATTTTMSVLEKIVDWNFGTDVVVPQLAWDQKDEEPLSVGDLADLVKAGALVVDDELENWIRGKYQMPDYTGGVPLPTKPSTPIQLNPGGSGEPITPDDKKDPAAPAASGVRAHGDHDQMDHGNRGVAPKKSKAKPKPATAEQADDDIEDDPDEDDIEQDEDHLHVIANPVGAVVTNVNASSQTVNKPGTVGHRQPTAVEVRAATDFAGMQADWEKETTTLVEAWGAVQSQQIDALIKDIEAAVTNGDDVALATLQAPVLGSDLILKHMTAMATQAINAAKGEAAAQNAEVGEVGIGDIADSLSSRANAIANLMAQSVSASASRNALMRYGADAAPADVGAGVRTQLESLSDSFLNDSLGGALTQAQNSARRAVFTAGKGDVTIYSSELLDENTCEECSAVDGTQYADQADADADYPTGGYVNCLGGPRCRGTEVAVYGEGAPQ